MDPFESYDSTESSGHLLQKVSWMTGPMGELIKKHLQTLSVYPPVQGRKSFDMSNGVAQFISHGHDWIANAAVGISVLTAVIG